MYQEIKPSSQNNGLIDSFWTFSGSEASESFKVLPDNCIDLIFDLSQNQAFVSGVMSKYQLRKLSPNSNLIGARFKVEKFSALSNVPLTETKNLRVDFTEVIPQYNPTILDRLCDQLHVNNQLSFIEGYITKLFAQLDQKQDELILLVAASIRLSKGIVDIRELAKTNHISSRQLERRFKKHVGLTMKEFSNVARFSNTKAAISSLADTSLLKIAFSTGFFDHSHMNYEFKRIAGESPNHFR